MMTPKQLTLPLGPGSRQTDPATSKAAGAAQTPAKRRASHARVVAMFRNFGDMHDKQLQAMLDEACRDTGIKPMSPSGVRSRRSELSKPNMDRLAELVREHAGIAVSPSDLFSADVSSEVVEWAREQLRREGFRSELWDTGKRERVDGYELTVWGIAR